MKTKLELVNVMVLNMGYARTTHHWGDEDLSSPFARLYYIKEGKAWLRFPEKTLEVRPGFMYLVPTFMPHSYECEPGFSFYYMFIYEKYQDKSGLFDFYEFPLEVKANEAVDIIFTQYCTLYPQLSLPYASAEEFSHHPTYHDYTRRYSQMERYERMQLQGMVWILSSYFMKHARVKESHGDDRIRMAMEFCQRNVEKDITLDMLADIACVTKSHLMRLFREKLGVSPMQYAIRKKIQTAQGLLLTTDMNIKQISQEIGISDSSYFVRMFKKNIGFTPQEYREKLR